MDETENEPWKLTPSRKYKEPPITGPFIEAHKNFHIGSYGIYQIFFLSLAVLYIMILGLILKMKPIKEKPVGEIFRDVITENLMKLRDLIASPP